MGSTHTLYFWVPWKDADLRHSGVPEMSTAVFDFQ